MMPRRGTDGHEQGGTAACQPVAKPFSGPWLDMP